MVEDASKDDQDDRDSIQGAMNLEGLMKSIGQLDEDQKGSHHSNIYNDTLYSTKWLTFMKVFDLKKELSDNKN